MGVNLESHHRSLCYRYVSMRFSQFVILSHLYANYMYFFHFDAQSSLLVSDNTVVVIVWTLLDWFEQTVWRLVTVADFEWRLYYQSSTVCVLHSDLFTMGFSLIHNTVVITTALITNMAAMQSLSKGFDVVWCHHHSTTFTPLHPEILPSF